MLNVVKRFLDGRWIRLFIVITYSYFCIIIVTEVVRRYVFGDSSAWGEMTARYSFVYMTYMAAAEAIRYKKHIRVDLIDRLASPNAVKLFKLYADVMTAFLAILIIYYSILLMKIQISVGIVMTAADINMAFAQAALPLGWALILIRLAQSWFSPSQLKNT